MMSGRGAIWSASATCRGQPAFIQRSRNACPVTDTQVSLPSLAVISTLAPGGSKARRAAEALL
jgi:hypothetical protein